MIFGSPDMKYSNSPVPERELVWAGEYCDGTYLSEFSFDTKQKNDFEKIRKSDLIRFGLIGSDHRMYYEVPGGVFKISGRMIEIIYRVGDKEYYLTGQPKMYNEKIITYKSAEATIDPSLSVGSGFNTPSSGVLKSSIISYSFGYKTYMTIDDINFSFQAIFTLSTRVNNPYIEIRVVANEDLDGQIIIKRNGRMQDMMEAPLRKGVAGVLNWEVF